MAATWRQVAFEERLDEWIAAEAPTDHLRRIVTAWVLGRLDNPYDGLRREPGFDNLWFGPVPGTYRAGAVVVCTLWIEESTRSVRCDRIATLHWPV